MHGTCEPPNVVCCSSLSILQGAVFGIARHNDSRQVLNQKTAFLALQGIWSCTTPFQWSKLSGGGSFTISVNSAHACMQWGSALTCTDV
jgi:hypothetical protein